MNLTTRTYAQGTSLTSSNPWGIFTAAKVLCSDGKVRQVKRIAQTADTFFSVPAAVTVRGKTVSGFVTVETMEGMSTESPADPPVVKFVAVKTGKNHDLLPDGSYRTPAPAPAN